MIATRNDYDLVEGNEKSHPQRHPTGCLFALEEVGFELAIFDCDPTSVARWVAQ